MQFCRKKIVTQQYVRIGPDGTFDRRKFENNLRTFSDERFEYLAIELG